MASGSCRDIAEDVYAALESGFELPPLPRSLETSMSLLSFQVRPKVQGHGQERHGQEDQGQEGQSHDGQGHKRNGRDNEVDPDAYQKQDGPGQSDGKKGQGKFKKFRDASSFSTEGMGLYSPMPSVLMLEALSKRRLDAVRQLHEACPFLLASIPVFDPVSYVDPNPQLYNKQDSSHTGDPEDGNGTSSSSETKLLLPDDQPPFRRTSQLLDRAAENKELLVFVLRNHPGIDRTESFQDDPEDFINDGKTHEGPNKHSRETVGEGTLRKGKGRQKTSSGKESQLGRDEEQHKRLIASLDPNGPLSVCLEKRNFDVLQYLLYKTVWQHFLLDDVFMLPQNSQVPDLDPNRPKSPYPEIDWFLHCCTLVGCSELLDRVLTGNFGTYYIHQHEKDQAQEVCTVSGTLLPSSLITNLEPGTSYNRPEKNTDSAFIELREQYIMEEAARPGRSDRTDPAVTQSPSDTLKNLREKTEKSVSSNDSNVQEGTSRLSRPETNQGGGNKPTSSRKQDKNNDALDGGAKQKQNSSNEDRLKDSAASQLAGTLLGPSAIPPLYCPDPNTRLPVSLPIMDRWISRCMHLSCTPLHLAGWRCDANSIRVLLKHGADVNALAEELENPEDKEADKNSGGGTHTHTSSSTASSEVSFLELGVIAHNVQFGALTSSSFDISASLTSLESAFCARLRGPHGVTPLALLALGVRSPPDFSLSIGRSLGLVLPVLPEAAPGGQTDRSCPETRAKAMEALKLLLDAGADVNAFSVIFKKSFRPLEIFLQPSVDLYYAPLMPRGGRDSAVLRCMDLERVAELVLSACWELCARGARPGPVFAASMEWMLFRMDWMFLQNEVLQRKFLHLALFLGLFPSMAPPVKTCSCFPDHPAAGPFPGGPSSFQRDPRPSPSGVNIGSPRPSRPSCIPWSRPQDDNSLDGSSSEHGGSSTHTSQPASHTDVTRQASDIGPQPPDVTRQTSGAILRMQSPTDVPGAPSTPDDVRFQPVSRDAVTLPSTSEGVVATYYGARGTMPHDVTPGMSSPVDRSRSTRASSAVVRSRPASPFGVDRNRVAPPAPNHRPGCPSCGVTPYAAQMAAWANEERQRRVMERFVSDLVRLSVPQKTLSLLLNFLSFSDLKLVTEIADSMAQAHDRQDETTWDRLREALRQARARSLRHSCKVVILAAIKFRYSSVPCLPLPESLKRYLQDSQC